MVSALSPASRYRRFHVGVGDPPADLLEALVRFDPATGIVLLATTREAGGDVAVGEARVVADESEPAAREFALAVVDAMQGRGLGTRLLRILIEYAESSGARRLYGDVLAENRPMLQLARKFGFVQRFHPNDPRLVRVQRDVDLQIRWSPRDQSRRGLDPVFN